MVKFIKRVVVRKKGMEALQAILLLAIALFVSKILKDQGLSSAGTASTGMANITKDAGK